MRCSPNPSSSSDLGLLIIDEEQHFGVGHKERLKQLREDVHVLTLTATPIPRTLQLALSGVREMSVIATPPVDRLAVRTFITPFDPVMVREALLRERYRGGQSFYVVSAHRRPGRSGRVPARAPARAALHACPRPDGAGAARRRHGRILRPAVRRAAVAPPSWSPASTFRTPTRSIVHRADMFGLAQLYQLRGRVGRSKTRAYALFTTAAQRQADARRREAAEGAAFAGQLGAGFTAREPRPRHSRRGQPAGRGAVRPHPRGGLRTVPVHAGRGGRRRCARAAARRRRKTNGRRDQRSAVRADPGGLCR